MTYKTRSERARDAFLAFLTFAFIYGVVSGLNYDISYYENNCYKETTVAEITKARHRTVWVRLANGTELELSQPSPAVYTGAPYCLDLRRERTDEELSWWMLPWGLVENSG